MEVRATTADEWDTDLAISGTYDAPVDFVASHGYRLWWERDGDRVLERGVALLERRCGELVPSEWVSTIVTEQRLLERFPERGETASVEISPFSLRGKTMSYWWSGSVRRTADYPDVV